jgi:hypothetical protein
MSDLLRLLKRAAERSHREVLKYRNSEDYRSPAWLFARCLKDQPEFRGLDAEAVTALIDGEVETRYPEHPAPWVALGLPDYDSKETPCDPRSDFLVVWNEVSTPFKPGALVHEAARCADEKPLDFKGRFRAADAAFERFLSICYWLENLSKGQFYLACRDAGDALGTSHMTANRLIQRAVDRGFLEPIGEYSQKDRARFQAKQWRFRWPYQGTPAFRDV